MENKQAQENQAIQNTTSGSELERIKLETDWAKAQVEIARIQAQIQTGWQDVIRNVSDKVSDRLERYSTQKASGERRYTTTLTVGILLFLVIIISALSVLTWRGLVGGESLIFFLGTVAGSVLMLVAERVRSEH